MIQSLKTEVPCLLALKINVPCLLAWSLSLFLSVSLHLSPTLFPHSLDPNLSYFLSMPGDIREGKDSIFYGCGFVTDESPVSNVHRCRKEGMPGSHWSILGRGHKGGDKLTRSIEWGPLANAKYCFCCFYKLMCYMLVLSSHINAQGGYLNLGRAQERR